MTLYSIKTERLLLRHWSDLDLPVFAAMNADPAVMEYFPSILSRVESDELAQKIREHMQKTGWGGWACETLREKKFIGFVGLHPNDDTSQGDTTEIAWRLSKDAWGQGYATEAAKAALHFAFSELRLASLISITTIGNQRSRAVMEKLGMENTGKNFDHPRLPADSPLLEHVLYLISSDQFARQNIPEPEILKAPSS